METFMVTAVKTNNRMAKKESVPSKSADGKGKAVHDVLAEHPQLKTTIAQIEKTFGEGSIMALGATEGATARVQGIPTGSLSLDLALGGVGLPKGRVIEIFGPESSGKTTLALHAVARRRRRGHCGVHRCRACAGSDVG